jgi:hypothetical protein
MVSHARFAKPCSAMPARAVERVVRALLGEGYALELQTDDAATLVYTHGPRHKLELHADGNNLQFDFHGASGWLSKALHATLDARATAAAEAAKDPPPPATLVDTSDHFHCRYCNGLTSSSQPNCRHCGAENFS